MTEKAITIVSAWSTRSHLNKDGDVDYTSTHTRPEHLDFYVKDGNLRLANTTVQNMSMEANTLTIKEVFVNGDSFVTEFHLRSQDQKA